ncbi:MAG: DUF1289 domain-containing protein [Pseudomonadales bacterium]|nr:DUF1289 domain-containing protein [Pseudomonadales bacterium]
MTQTRRTPCVGICSTTYGDLVCRGCKRFAHEIVQWNGYEASQQQQIWARLQGLRDEVVEHTLTIIDKTCYDEHTQAKHLQDLAAVEQRYELVRHLAIQNMPLSAGGLQTSTATDDALTTLQAIDGEIYRRSLAHYERNYKIPV